MTTYLVPAGYGEAEYIEKRSRFIARVWPIDSETEAVAHIEAMRKQHYDARHNVYAYIVREGGIMRYSDDGEPQGTSGQPTLNVFRGQEIQNFCCVVTRYFGGILLGTGGLVRAYTTAAKMALENAGISRMALWKSIELGCTYSQYERIKRLLEEHEAVIENTDFGADIVFSALLREDMEPAFGRALTELSAGTADYLIDGESFRGVRIK